jgi:hypothetical protein
MRRIDEQFLKTPFYGSRRMTACLERSLVAWQYCTEGLGMLISWERLQLESLLEDGTGTPSPWTTSHASAA